MNRPTAAHYRRNTVLVVLLYFASFHSGFAEGVSGATPTALPDTAASVWRILGALAFVLALFFAGVWAFRNWQRITQVRSRSRLDVFESRSLGPRQALYVVGYDQQRFLVAASPSGISLISSLPSAPSQDIPTSAMSREESSFAHVLRTALTNARPCK